MGRTAAYRAAGTLVLACGVLAGTAPDTVVAQARPQNSDGLDVVKVRDNVFMIAGAGGNITAHVGPAGVIVVDSGSGAMSDKALAAISRLSEHPIRYIINTSAHREHVGDPPELARRAFNDSFSRLLAALEPVTDEELFADDRWPWLGGEALVETILWDSSRHYEEHLEHLEPLWR